MHRGSSSSNHPTIPHRRMSVWLVAPPFEARKIASVDAVIDDLLGEFWPYNDGAIYSSESRRYRATSEGRQALTEALSLRCIDWLAFGEEQHAHSSLHLYDNRNRWTEGEKDSLSIDFSALVGGVELLSTVEATVACMLDWFTLLDAGYAMISFDESGSWPTETSWERSHTRPSPYRDTPMVDLCRGVFWVNFLGQDMCDLLGGKVAVAEHAPVARAEVLSNGVLLQLTPSPTTLPNGDQYLRLSKFLQPLLDRRLQPPSRTTSRIQRVAKPISDVSPGRIG